MRILIQVMLVLVVLFSPVASAQNANPPETFDKRRLLVQPRNQPVVPFLEDPVLWVSEKQREFYGSLSTSLRRIKSSSPASAAWTLVLVSFAYGVFHAAGPGHGKAVVSTWILANKSDLRRGIFIAFMSALIQALTAILIVSVLMLFFSNATALAKKSAGVLDAVSFAMIAGIGVYLMWSVFRRGHARTGHLHADGHHHHDHVHDASCGHAHVPSPSQVRGDVSFLQMLSLAFAVGIRPCTGAILMLVFAWSAGIYWAGVLSALVMGFGVFLTIAAIAMLSVYAKTLALRFSGADDLRLEKIVNILKFAGGAVIAAFGALMFLGAYSNGSGLT